MKASNIFSDPQGFIEEHHGADLDSDGTIGKYQISDMHDEQYGGQLIKNGGERCGDYYTKKLSPQLEEMEQRVEGRLDQLDQQIATTEDPGELQELQQLRDQIAGEWDDLMANPHQYIDTGDEIGNFIAFKGRWDDSLKEIDGLLSDAGRAIGPLPAGAEQTAAPTMPPPESIDGIDASGVFERVKDVLPNLENIFSGRTSGAEGTTQADAAGGADKTSGASGSSGASESGGLGAMEFDGQNVDGMIEMMHNDPDALMDHLGGLGAEDKQMAMQMMMQRLQEINQMFSMLSNMMKSMHDTAKASINNMRV